MIRLTTPERRYVPDVVFKTDEGEKNNRDLPEGEQIWAEIRLATIDEKTRFLGSYQTFKGRGASRKTLIHNEMKASAAVSSLVDRVHGFEEAGVKTGKDLVAKQRDYVEFGDLVQDLFLAVIGAGSGQEEEIKEGE